MPEADNGGNSDFLAEARRNLKAPNAPASSPPAGNSSNGVPPSRPASGRQVFGFIGRALKGLGFLLVVQFAAISFGFISIWLSPIVAVLAAAFCFSGRLKKHGIALVVGVLLVVLAPMDFLAMRSYQQEEQALLALRETNPIAYLEKAKARFSREKWLSEAKVLAPDIYEVENAKDVAARTAVQQRVAAEQQAKIAKAESDNRMDACRSDWSKCSDNKEIVNNYRGITDAQFSCRSSAEKQAAYGTPEWPWGAFGTFRVGDSGPKNGEIELIEKNAKFENGFGAMKHVIVRCFYDLKTSMVQYVEIN